MSYEIPKDLIDDSDVIKSIAEANKNIKDSVGYKLEDIYRYAKENNCKIGYIKSNTTFSRAGIYFKEGITAKNNDINKLVCFWSDNPPFPVLLHQMRLAYKAKNPTTGSFIIVIPNKNIELNDMWIKNSVLNPIYIHSYVYNESGELSDIIINESFIMKERFISRIRK